MEIHQETILNLANKSNSYDRKKGANRSRTEKTENQKIRRT
jgi:hypothetical protein